MQADQGQHTDPGAAPERELGPRSQVRLLQGSGLCAQPQPSTAHRAAGKPTSLVTKAAGMAVM